MGKISELLEKLLRYTFDDALDIVKHKDRKKSEKIAILKSLLNKSLVISQIQRLKRLGEEVSDAEMKEIINLILKNQR